MAAAPMAQKQRTTSARAAAPAATAKLWPSVPAGRALSRAEMADIMAMLAASAHHRAAGFANKISFGVKEVGIRGVWRRGLTAARGYGSMKRTFCTKKRTGGRGGGEMYFEYGETELQYLRSRDKRIGEVIDRVGMIRREVDPDLFAAVVHHIVGQQISTKAQATVWRRMQEALGTVDAGSVLAAGPEGLQALGISGRKAAYITDFALRVQSGAFDPETVRESSDAEAIRQLCTLKGVGVWTAEMILLFCLQRPDIFSYDDLAIQRGLRMVYHHRQVSRELFEKYRRRYSPYGSVASLYLWAVAGGAVPELRDYAPQGKKGAK